MAKTPTLPPPAEPSTPDPVNLREALEERFKVAAAQEVQPELHLRPDKYAKYEIVAHARLQTAEVETTLKVKSKKKRKKGQ